MSLDEKKTWCGKGYFYPEYDVKQFIKELKRKAELDEIDCKIVDDLAGKGLI